MLVRHYVDIQAVKNILPECNFRHVRRGIKKVAHNLKALRQQECVVTCYNAPQCVRELINAEAAGIDGASQICNLNVP
jgi:hypothetical protein